MSDLKEILNKPISKLIKLGTIFSLLTILFFIYLTTKIELDSSIHGEAFLEVYLKHCSKLEKSHYDTLYNQCKPSLISLSENIEHKTANKYLPTIFSSQKHLYIPLVRSRQKTHNESQVNLDKLKLEPITYSLKLGYLKLSNFSDVVQIRKKQKIIISPSTTKKNSKKIIGEISNINFKNNNIAEIESLNIIINKQINLDSISNNFVNFVIISEKQTLLENLVDKLFNKSSFLQVGFINNFN